VSKIHKTAPSEPRTYALENNICDEMVSHCKCIHMKEAIGDTIITVKNIESATVKKIKVNALKGKIFSMIHEKIPGYPRILQN